MSERGINMNTEGLKSASDNADSKIEKLKKMSKKLPKKVKTPREKFIENMVIEKYFRVKI